MPKARSRSFSIRLRSLRRLDQMSNVTLHRMWMVTLFVPICLLAVISSHVPGFKLYGYFGREGLATPQQRKGQVSRDVREHHRTDPSSNHNARSRPIASTPIFQTQRRAIAAVRANRKCRI